MKKLLSLLSVLTISGTAVPTTIAASPYQKEEQIKLENLKRVKRYTSANRNEITYSGWHTYLHISRPKWPTIVNMKNQSNTYAEFKNKIYNLFYSNWTSYDYVASTCAFIIWNNFTRINNEYDSLNPGNGLRIHFYGYEYNNSADLINVSPQCTECNS